MSEPLLKAIIQLFAIVAKEDEVTRQEREQIAAFLIENLNSKAVENYLQQFDEYCKTLINSNLKSEQEEQQQIEIICKKINEELTQKQKVVIILELMAIILADGHISTREDELLHLIGSAFNIDESNVKLIKDFVEFRSISDIKSDQILLVSDQDIQSDSFKHIKRESLNGVLCFLHLSSADTYFVKYLGTSNIYLNGIPLKANHNVVFGNGATIRIEKCDPLYFGDVIGQFIQRKDENRISFKAENISFQFGNGQLGLRNINIEEESGTLVGLMGASGAGKSTLLNVLNGYDSPSEGEVHINGINIHKKPDQIEGVIGFVPQDDLLIEELSVYQNLYYAAKLCFDHFDNTEIDKLVILTLNNLGLTETKDLKVGSPLDKTISGGQRKRLNIGLELLREPSVMFVDEPTSGLSSRDSENIMDLLKELTLKGKLIFVVIHQPSSDIFKMFNKLVILDTGGYQIYYGNPVEAVVYFKDLINFINSEQGECIECGNVNPEQIFNIIETKVINEYGNFTNERKILPEQWNKFYLDRTIIPKVKSAKLPPKSTLKIPNKLKQLGLFATRDVLAKISNKQYLLINLLEAPVLALLLAYIVRYFNEDSSIHTSYTFSDNLNIPAYLFMSVIVALFMGLTVSAEEIIRDRKILKRESFLNLSRGSYLYSKLFILFTLSAIQTFMFVLIGNTVLQIEGMFISHWLILFSTSCFANILGLNISSAFNSAVTIYILIPILLIPQLLLSGVVVSFDKLNPDLSSEGEVPIVGDIMASRWAFEAAMVTQFKDNAFEELFYTYEKVMAKADYKKIYYLPALNSHLEYSLNNLNTSDKDIHEKMVNSLNLVKNEITKELELIGTQRSDFLEELNIDRFDSTTYSKASELLKKLNVIYVKRYNKADLAKDDLIISMTNTEDKKIVFDKFKETYRNERIAEVVRNQNEQHRIIESGGYLHQKIFPIYKDPNPNHILDYRSQFYVAKKHFLGRNFDTLYFNITVLWIMSTFLFILLYFDILRKFVELLDFSLSKKN